MLTSSSAVHSTATSLLSVPGSLWQPPPHSVAVFSLQPPVLTVQFCLRSQRFFLLYSSSRFLGKTHRWLSSCEILSAHAAAFLPWVTSFLEFLPPCFFQKQWLLRELPALSVAACFSGVGVSPFLPSGIALRNCSGNPHVYVVFSCLQKTFIYHEVLVNLSPTWLREAHLSLESLFSLFSLFVANIIAVLWQMAR